MYKIDGETGKLKDEVEDKYTYNEFKNFNL